MSGFLLPARENRRAPRFSASGDRFDAIVVGAGFGGLGSALALAERGARVALLEALSYPGGCASTFERQGCRFESGATLFSGLGRGQLFRRWIDRYSLPVEVEWLDPVVRFRAPDFSIDVPRRRSGLLERFAAQPGAPVRSLCRFFDLQSQVADVLWELLDSPELLPPFGLSGLERHALRLPRYRWLLRWAGRPLLSVLKQFGLAEWKPLRIYLDALCQITVQCSAAEAEAPFALATMDYYYRGTGHVRGGIGTLAWGLVEAIRSRGGEISLTDRVRSIDRHPGEWVVSSRRGERRAEQVVANVLPGELASLLGEERPTGRLASLDRQVATGWGACLLYLVLDPSPHLPREAMHYQLVDDATAPFLEGNHVFCSISSTADGQRAPDGGRTVTVSTHVPMGGFLALPEHERGEYVATVQQRMRETIARRAPEWASSIRSEMTASPRTFERFTRRSHGYVGGVPRRAGLRQYLQLGNPAIRSGLHLVGDSVFPGQSTLATALGGVKVAERIRSRRAR